MTIMVMTPMVMMTVAGGDHDTDGGIRGACTAEKGERNARGKQRFLHKKLHL